MNLEILPLFLRNVTNIKNVEYFQYLLLQSTTCYNVITDYCGCKLFSHSFLTFLQLSFFSFFINLILFVVV